MNDNIENTESDVTESPVEDENSSDDFTDIETLEETSEFIDDMFRNFLTPDDIFRMEFEKYYPEFMKRVESRTLYEDDEFRVYSNQMIGIAREAGYDLQEKIIEKFNQENGHNS